MMLNELRVGSIVTHPIFGTPTNVKAIAFNGLYIGTKDGLPLHIDDFKPVKITDEVLESLHFVKMKDTAPGIGEFDWWETDDISLTHIHKGLYGIDGNNRHLNFIYTSSSRSKDFQSFWATAPSELTNHIYSPKGLVCN